MHFVDREAELAALERRLREGSPQLIRVYGRRRLGKTELLKQLARGRRTLFLTLPLGDEATQLRSLSRQVGESLETPPRPYASLEDFLDHVQRLGPEIVVLDEFQRLVQVDTASPSEIQRRWDHGWKEEGPSLVLCGSSVGMMARLTGARPAPLYGRFTADLHLGPMGYTGIRQFYPGLSEEERIRRFAVFGATPYYHVLGLRRDLHEAIEEAFLRPPAPLREEPELVLRLEVNEPARYVSILEALGHGARVLHDLESRVGVPKGGLGSYLKVLGEDLDLVETELPIGRQGHPQRYIFRDPFFEFYYRCVYDLLPRLESSALGSVWEQLVPSLESHVGRVFERVVREALRRASGGKIKGVPARFDRVGAWWSRRGEEVDVVAEGTDELWVGEVKWSKGRLDVSVVYDLLAKLPLLSNLPGKAVRPVIVARGGLTEEASRALQEVHGLSLDLTDLVALLDHAPRP